MDQFSIMLVDDEEDFLMPLQKRLRKRGLDCEAMLSGREALERLRERDFDVVLLDMKLTDRDGIDVLREIRDFKPRTQVIILSGHASASDGRQGMGIGAFDYLIKPVEFETLCERLEAASRGKSALTQGLGNIQ